MGDQVKGGIHICSSGYDRVGEGIRNLYKKYCNDNGKMKDGLCGLDKNRQFILVGSDEFVDSIFDPDLFDASKTKLQRLQHLPIWKARQGLILWSCPLKKKKTKKLRCSKPKSNLWKKNWYQLKLPPNRIILSFWPKRAKGTRSLTRVEGPNGGGQPRDRLQSGV